MYVPTDPMPGGLSFALTTECRYLDVDTQLHMVLAPVLTFVWWKYGPTWGGVLGSACFFGSLNPKP